MSKELQQKWDTLLMRAWIKEKNIGWVAYHFFDKKREVDVINELVRLGIKRSFHMAAKSSPSIGFKVPVRAFIDKYCRTLSDRLWNGEPALMFAFSLDEFNWENLNHKVNSKGRAVMSKRSRNIMRTRHYGMSGGALHESRRGWNVTK